MIRFLVQFLLILIVLMVPASSLQAQSDTVTFTVKISICGDFIAEADEECDNEDLRNETCFTKGYYQGDLSCTPACELDTSDCFDPIPTPTPTPTLTPTPLPTFFPSSTPTPTPHDSSQEETDPSPSTTLAPLTPTPTFSNSLPQLIPTFLPLPLFDKLPVELNLFDPNQDGRLTAAEMPYAVSLWLESLEADDHASLTNCDLNQDKTCNLTDFSVLMYYINK